MTFQDLQALPGLAIPNCHRTIQATRRQARAIWAERQTAETAAWVAACGEGKQQHSCFSIPQFEEPIHTGRGDPIAIRAEGNIRHTPFMGSDILQEVQLGNRLMQSIAGFQAIRFIQGMQCQESAAFRVDL